MIGTGAIVSERLARIVSDEERTGMAQLSQQRFRIGDRELEMLGCNPVRNGARFVEIARENQCAAPREGRGDDRCARHRRQQAARAFCDACDDRRIRRQQDRLRHFVVLGLREKVERHPVGIGGSIGDHQHFRRPRDHVDADGTEDAPLGRGDIRIAGTADLVDSGDRRGSIGERGDRLRAADRVRPRHAGDMRGGEHQRVACATRRRNDHDDVRHACHVRGKRVHQHR